MFIIWLIYFLYFQHHHHRHRHHWHYRPCRAKACLTIQCPSTSVLSHPPANSDSCLSEILLHVFQPYHPWCFSSPLYFLYRSFIVFIFSSYHMSSACKSQTFHHIYCMCTIKKNHSLLLPFNLQCTFLCLGFKIILTIFFSIKLHLVILIWLFVCTEWNLILNKYTR